MRAASALCCVAHVPCVCPHRVVVVFMLCCGCVARALSRCCLCGVGSCDVVLSVATLRMGTCGVCMVSVCRCVACGAWFAIVVVIVVVVVGVVGVVVVCCTWSVSVMYARAW